MKKLFAISSLTLILMGAACSGGTTPPNPVPAAAAPTTVVPIENPPATETLVPAAQPPASAQDQPTLTGTTWVWIGFTGPNEQFVVESPMNYSLVFQENGTLRIMADCNNAQGSYHVEGQSMKIEVGPMTKAMCPPGSRSDEFIQYLGNAAFYSFQDGNLNIDLMGDGGTIVFASSEVVAANNGGEASSDALLANPWQWISFVNPVEKYDVESPPNYLLTFHGDGTLEIKADCNNASGTYTMDGGKISIVVGPTTLAACPPGSRSDEFIRYLGNAAIYFFQPGELFIDLVADGGTMRFNPFNQGN